MVRIKSSFAALLSHSYARSLFWTRLLHQILFSAILRFKFISLIPAITWCLHLILGLSLFLLPTTFISMFCLSQVSSSFLIIWLYYFTLSPLLLFYHIGKLDCHSNDFVLNSTLPCNTTHPLPHFRSYHFHSLFIIFSLALSLSYISWLGSPLLLFDGCIKNCDIVQLSLFKYVLLSFWNKVFLIQSLN